MVTEARCALCTCFSVSSTLVSTTWQQEIRYLAYTEAWSHAIPDEDHSGLQDASLPHDYLMGAKTLVMLLSSPKPSWPGGTEGPYYNLGPYCNLAPLSPFAVHLT